MDDGGESHRKKKETRWGREEKEVRREWRTEGSRRTD
jgi:hypothetical protein